jgi:hypothetical protein
VEEGYWRGYTVPQEDIYSDRTRAAVDVKGKFLGPYS